MWNIYDKEIIDVAHGNIIEQFSRDKVVLAGEYPYNDSEFIDNVEILVLPKNGEETITAKIHYSGYNFKLFLGDFNGDGRSEIMVRGRFDSSSELEIVDIYTYEKGRLKEIFNQDLYDEKYKFKAKYLDDYKVEVLDIIFKEKYILDISSRPKIYLDFSYNRHGKFEGNSKPIVSSINEAYPINSIYEDTYNLFIRQQIVGVSIADTIGVIETFVVLLENKIRIIECGVMMFGDKIRSRY